MWSKDGQAARFAAVLAALNPQPGETLLDFGCGTGAFYEHVPSVVVYLGHDWSRGMIARARREHPDGEYTSALPPGPFDLVACIGPFNLRENWSAARTWETLQGLWMRCSRALAVSLYRGLDPDCLIYTPEEIAAEAAAFPNATAAVTYPRQNDVMLTLTRTAP